MKCTWVKVWKQDEVWSLYAHGQARILGDLVRNSHSRAPSRSSIVSLLEEGGGVSLVDDCEVTGGRHPVDLVARRAGVPEISSSGFVVTWASQLPSHTLF